MEYCIPYSGRAYPIREQLTIDEAILEKSDSQIEAPQEQTKNLINILNSQLR